MNTYKWTLSLLLALLSTCVMAQTSHPLKNRRNTPVGNAVERAVLQALADAHEDWDPGLRMQAQTLLNIDKIRHGGVALHTLEYYYNQLWQQRNNPQFVTSASNAVAEDSTATPTSADEEELSIQELIDAETELAYIRNMWDPHASFDKYPYLLNPQYRRTSNEQVRQQIRQTYQTGKRQAVTPQKKDVSAQQTALHSFRDNPNSTWARKVGI